MRDIYSHNLTTPEHWTMSLNNFAVSRDEITASFVHTDIKSYDPHCSDYNEVSNGCQPVKILSGELLVNHTTGPAENRKIAEVLMNHDGMAEWVIAEDAWECIWTELIINRKGVKTFLDRDGLNESDYSFSPEMLEEMIHELDRLIEKYSAPDWNFMEIAQDLVSLLSSHKGTIEEELQLVNEEILRDSDFLGPKERKKRKMAKILASLKVDDLDDERLLNSSEDYSEYFKALARHLLERRHKAHKEEVMENERLRRARQLNAMKKDAHERQLRDRNNEE